MILDHRNAVGIVERAHRPGPVNLVIEGNSLSIILRVQTLHINPIVLIDTLREPFPDLSERKGGESRTPVL
jgi:hypothetical protein